jgi:sigma-B regulation protein RsbU (phosphoserine phosphatase)
MSTIASLTDLQAIEKLRQEELDEARVIQGGMLPEESLHARGVHIAHEFQPAAAVGGDFLDYFELSDGTLGLYLGDVSGKGLPAAMYAALAVGTLRGVHKTGQPPCNVLSTLNRRLLLRGLPRRYSAVQYALFDPLKGHMNIVSAGMPGPFHLTGGGCRALALPGMPPGLFAEAQYDVLTLTLEPGDAILFCTDGITDAFNLDEDSFGIARLQEVCAPELRGSPTELLGRIFAAVGSFAHGREQHDDMTAAAFYYERAGAA